MSKCFQLEEKEDRCTCITEIVLAEDNTLHIGNTDGPQPTSSHGTWMIDHQDERSTFTMKLERTFKTGYSGTDMGEFFYPVERTFVGELTKAGALDAIEGSIHIPSLDNDDTLGSETTAIGYFSMIDITNISNESEDFTPFGGAVLSYST